MGILIDALQESVGTVKHWVRPSAATPLPPNFVILDGSTLVDPDSPFNGMVMKDMRGKFLQGHPTLTNANFAADLTYHFGLGGVIPSGGSASVDLTHDHAAGAHVHSIGSHSHTLTSDGLHAHNAPNHSHGINSDGTHTHGGTTDSSGVHSHNIPFVSGPILTGSGGYPASTDQSGSHSHNLTNMSSAGNHSHGGGTNSAGGTTDQSGSHAHGGSTGGASGTTAAGTGNTSTSLGVIDKTPPWLGFIAMVKVK